MIGAERVAQLVGEHRQELVLAAVEVGQGLRLLVARSSRRRSVMSRMLHWMTGLVIHFDRDC